MSEIGAFAFASVALLVALGALYLLGRFSIAQGRFDVDAQQRAVNLQRYIDTQVERRVVYAPRAVVGKSTTSGGPILDQPADPGVRQTTRLDDVREAERDANRIMGEPDLDPVRDVFDEQPMVET